MVGAGTIEAIIVILIYFGGLVSGVVGVLVCDGRIQVDARTVQTTDVTQQQIQSTTTITVIDSALMIVSNIAITNNYTNAQTNARKPAIKIGVHAN